MDRFKKWKQPKIKHNKLTKWNWIVGYPKGLRLGKNVDIGAFTYINAKYGVIICSDSQIGSHCSIYSHDTERDITGLIVIRHGTLIGSHTVILPKKGEPHFVSGKIKAGSVLY